MKSLSASGVYQCLAEVMVTNRRGLHARASNAFAKLVERFDAEVTVSKDGESVSGSSVLNHSRLSGSSGARTRVGSLILLPCP